MKLSFSSGTFSRYPPEQNLAEIARLSFENIEFNMKSVKTEDYLTVYSLEKLVKDLD